MLNAVEEEFIDEAYSKAFEDYVQNYDQTYTVPDNVRFHTYKDGSLASLAGENTNVVILDCFSSFNKARGVYFASVFLFEELKGKFLISKSSRSYKHTKFNGKQYFMFMNNIGHLNFVEADHAGDDNLLSTCNLIRRADLRPYCSWCGDASARHKYCQGCLKTKYCSKECQKSHWDNGHKDCQKTLSPDEAERVQSYISAHARRKAARAACAGC